jgi:hypothetical protein
MLDREFPILMDNDMTRIAVSAVLAGAVLIRLASWTAVGWAVVAFGVLTLWLAHQLAIAPEIDEGGAWLGSA